MKIESLLSLNETVSLIFRTTSGTLQILSLITVRTGNWTRIPTFRCQMRRLSELSMICSEQVA